MNMRRLRNLRRCNNYPTLIPEDVAQHSYYVTLLAKAFFDEANSFAVNKMEFTTLMNKCLLHDMEEAFVSDIPYPIKHASKKFHDELNDIIDSGMSSMIHSGDTNTTISLWEGDRKRCKDGIEGSVVALCDMLELAIYCYEEVKLGNTACKTILNNCRIYLPTLFNTVTQGLFDNPLSELIEYDLVNVYFPSFYEIYLMVFDDTFSTGIDEVFELT